MFLYKKLSPKAYNLVLGGIVLYALVANILLCLFCGPIFSRMDPVALILGELILSIIGIFFGRSKNLKVRFLGYNLIVIPFGAVLTAILPVFAAEAVFLAIVLTAVVTVGLITLSTLFPAYFSRLGPALGIALLLSLTVDIITWLLGYPLNIITGVYVVLFPCIWASIGIRPRAAIRMYPTPSNPPSICTWTSPTCSWTCCN